MPSKEQWPRKEQKLKQAAREVVLKINEKKTTYMIR